tara:strand:- start:98 stop:454 length:357 start_codon:yes stop_codon:yes gene_type:complete
LKNYLKWITHEECSCGICKHDKNANIPRCSICLRFRCLGVQQRLAYEKCSICSNCVNNNIHQLEKIFVDGKNEKGKWIVPAHKIEITTCMCGKPWSQMCAINWISASSQGKKVCHKPL